MYLYNCKEKKRYVMVTSAQYLRNTLMHLLPAQFQFVKLHEPYANLHQFDVIVCLPDHFAAFFSTSSACLSVQLAVFHFLVLFTFLRTCITNVGTKTTDLSFMWKLYPPTQAKKHFHSFSSNELAMQEKWNFENTEKNFTRHNSKGHGYRKMNWGMLTSGV